MSLLGEFIALADDLTNQFGLKPTVGYRKYTHADGAGQKFYETETPVEKRALVVRATKLVRRFDGTEGVSTAQVTFLDPTVVSEHDEITLPDGTKPVIVSLSGFVDDTQATVYTDIYLG